MSVAKIVPPEYADGSIKYCQKCDTPLIEENGGPANLMHGLCLECLTKILGAHKQESVALLLSRGVVMVAYYSTDNTYKLRVEIRSARRSELLKCMRDLGAGRVYGHSPGVSRWSASSMKDIHHVGGILMQFIPELGIFLQNYVVQPDPATRSAYAEAFVLKMGRKSIHIVEFL